MNAFNWQLPSLKGLKTEFLTPGLIAFALVTAIGLHGIVVALWQHPAEARARITAGQRWADETAREAAALPEDAPLMLVAPPEFGALERITLADYVAAYGERRALIVRALNPHP